MEKFAKWWRHTLELYPTISFCNAYVTVITRIEIIIADDSMFSGLIDL